MDAKKPYSVASPEMQEQIAALAATLDSVAASYRYMKARCMLDPDYAEYIRERKRSFVKKKYAENPEYREKAKQTSKENQPTNTANRRVRYQTDKEYRALVLQRNRAAKQGLTSAS